MDVHFVTFYYVFSLCYEKTCLYQTLKEYVIVVECALLNGGIVIDLLMSWIVVKKETRVDIGDKVTFSNNT